MTEDFEREAELLRQALRHDADAQAFAPLDTAELLGARGKSTGSSGSQGREEATAESVEAPTLRQAQGSGQAQGSERAHGPRRARGARRPVTAADWGRGILAAAASVALIALGATVLPRLVSGGAAGSAAVPEPPRAGASAAASEADAQATEPASGPLGGAAPAPAQDGWRWESYRDVMVQVPAEWGYDASLTSAWCATADGSGIPSPSSGPFVDLRRGDEPIPAIGCSGEPPSNAQAMHLSFRPRTAAAAKVLGQGDWQESTRELGAARLVVVAEPADADLAREILDSAVQVGADHNGCPAVEPETTAPDIVQLAPQVISVCLYDTVAEPQPSLRSSVELAGDAAAAALAAIEAAPGGGGPDADPAECGPARGASRAVLLLDGVAVGFDFAGCAGNGLADSGAAGGLRRVTADLCRTLLTEPVRVWTGSGPAAEVCLGAIWDR